MLQIVVPDTEFWDSDKQEFLSMGKDQVLQLEHSLVSISKWEAKWNKEFLGKEKTDEELLDYIRCMTLTQHVHPLAYHCITRENFKAIVDYIDAPMTATKFHAVPGLTKTRSNEPITSELIYYWMISYNIPFECQKWHLNRLLTLIRVCSVKNQPQKKLSPREIMTRNAALNASRRKALNTRG